jgi:hypothetical protein
MRFVDFPEARLNLAVKDIRFSGILKKTIS